MTSTPYSFIDVAILDGVRERFAAGDALAILSEDLEELIWANGPGALLFGLADIEAVGGADSGLSYAAKRQIMSTSNYPRIGSDRGVVVRLAKGIESRAYAFLASELTLPDGEEAILLAVPAGLPDGRETEVLESAIGGFTEPGHLAAFIDARGAVEAASPGFAALGIATQTLADMASDALRSGRRLVKKIIPAQGASLPAGMARLRDTPARHLLVVVDERAMGHAVPSPAAPAPRATAAPVQTATRPTVPAAAPARSAVAVPATGDVSRLASLEPQARSAPVPAEEAPQPVTVAPARPSPPQPPTMPRPPEPSSPSPVAQPRPADGIPAEPAIEREAAPTATVPATLPETAALPATQAAPDVPERTAAVTAAAPDAGAQAERTDQNETRQTPLNPDDALSRTQPVDREKQATLRGPGRLLEVGDDADSSAAPRIVALSGRDDPQKKGAAVDLEPDADRAASPVRFAWKTDAEGRFTAISPEFVRAVGPLAGNVVGRLFKEVSDTLGLDPYSEIAGLLERRDTWSGRSVFWPITGTDLRVPVDLAALPVYGRDRSFEGFRGFGVARMADTVVDPEALGQHLAGGGDHRAKVQRPVDKAPEVGSSSDDHAGDPFKGEVPALVIAQQPDRRQTDKIIKLAEHRAAGPEKALSPIERSAFREIGERLRVEDGTFSPGAGAAATPAGSLPTEPDWQAAGPMEAGADDVTPPSDPQPWPVDRIDDQAHDRESASRSDTSLHERASELSDRSAAMPKGEAANVASLDVTSSAEPEAPAPAASRPPEPKPAVEVPPSETVPVVRRAATLAGTTPEMPALAPGSAAFAPRPSSAELKVDGFLPSAFSGPSATPRKPTQDTPILSRLPVPLLVHSGDVLHYANDEFLALTGYESVEQLSEAGGLGALFSEHYDGENAEDDGDDRAIRLRTRDGLEFPIDALLRSVPWNGGKALMLVVRRTGTDDEAEPVPAALAPVAPAPDAGPAIDAAALKARVSEMRTIIDTATDGVILIANDGTIRSISRPAEALFGFDTDDLAGKPFVSLFAIESQRAARDYLAGLSDNGVASVLNDGREVIGREAQGRFIPLFMTIGKLPGESGYCAVVRDITQWKRAEEELTQAKALAERASSQKTDFLARVSHEIRTPLNAIIGFSELMVDERFGPIANERYRDYLRDINRSGNHVLDLVNDLLDISKIEAGEQEMSYEAVSLNDTLSETVAMMQPQANRERVIIRSSFASRLPDVVADLRSVRQIALNILSNAVRYTQAGGQVIISTSYEPSGDVVIRVRDTGIGMSTAEIEQAMKPFKQINSLKRPRGDGTGLGLPLTKAMVEANRARFSLTSSPGDGTLVEVIFPATRVLAD